MAEEKPTVTVQIYGGMCNQFFQYAAGRAYALRGARSLILDPHWFRRNHDRELMLERFQIQGRVETPALIRGDVRRKSWRTLAGLLGFEVATEQSPKFGQIPPSAAKRVILSGYFQSEKYFLDYANLIRAELTPTPPAKGPVTELAARLRQENSASVHVRRGDYVSNPAASAHHGLCGVGYYRNAKLELEKRVPDPLYVIFSDDDAWVKENFGFFKGALFASDFTKGDPVQDLWLMAQCRHSIIANSSFSWWGAWLGDSPEKIVIAPERWLTSPGFDTSDILPERWKKVGE